MNPYPQDLQNVIDWIRHEVLEGDWVVKIGSSTLSIGGDWLKKSYMVKSLAKVVEILEQLFLMISYSYYYKIEWLITCIFNLEYYHI